MVFATEWQCKQIQWFNILVCCLSVLLTIVSVPINTVVLFTIIKNKKFHTVFYIIVLNTTLSDCLISVVICPLSIWFYTKEIQNDPVNHLAEKAFLCVLFTLCIVSVLCIAILSIDRIISLKFPSQYRVMEKKHFIIALIGVWILASGLTPLYGFMELKVYLPIISALMILVTTVVMCVTYALYRIQLKRSYTLTHINRVERGGDENDNPNISNNSSLISLPMSLKRKFSRQKKDSIASFASSQQTKLDVDYQSYQMEKRATNTFFCMMVAFLFSYIPIAVLILSIGLYVRQPDNECWVVNILQGCVVLLGIISSVFKTAVFLVRLTALRKACANLFISEEEMERKWRKESVPVTITKKERLKEQLLVRKPDDIQEEITV